MCPVAASVICSSNSEWQDDRRTSGILEPLDGVEVVPEGRSARHEGMRQLKTEI